MEHTLPEITTLIKHSSRLPVIIKLQHANQEIKDLKRVIADLENCDLKDVDQVVEDTLIRLECIEKADMEEGLRRGGA